MTYQNDYNLMFSLGLLQFIFLICQCCCCCIPLYGTPVKDDEYEEEKIRMAQQSEMNRQMMML